MAEGSHGYHGKDKRVADILGNPDLFPDEFKNWLTRFVQNDPSLAVPLNAIPRLRNIEIAQGAGIHHSKLDLTGGISTGQLVDNSVTNAKMADNAIGNAELQDNSVSTAKLQAEAVTPAKIQEGANGEFLSTFGGAAVWESPIDFEILLDAVTAVDLDANPRTVDSATLTLPSGWNTMDVWISGSLQFNNVGGTDHRVFMTVESPSGTNQFAMSGQLIGTAVFPAEVIAVPICGVIFGADDQEVLLEAEITGGTTTLGDVIAQDLFWAALKVRRT